MKVGIITFINTINYGAVLQAYALQESIESLGIRAEVVQYTNKTIEKKEKNIGILSLRGLLKSIVMGSGIQKKIRAFQVYEDQHIHKGSALTPASIEQVNADYDYFVTGSDQVWNMRLINRDWYYFLSFVKEDRKKVSYAPSFGNDVFPQDCYDEARKYLVSIPALSVREASGQALIQKIAQRQAEIVLDPTLLLNRKEWEQRISFRPALQHYILVYFPNNKARVFDFVAKLQKKTNYPVIYLSISPRPQKGVKTIYDASPDEFLGWMRHADYVVTGSFHGTAFSLNLEKQFFYEPSGEGSRIDYLVRLTGTENRRIDREQVVDEDIDYTAVTKRLNAARQNSWTWLKQALGVPQTTL